MTGCNIYDINLNRIGALFTWVSLVWDEEYNTMGSFQIELQATEKNRELIQEDRYVSMDDSDTLMLIESVQIADNMIVANGFPATRILEHRVSTEEISNKNAEESMRGLISSMSPWECVELGESAGFTDRFTPQTSDQTVEEYCETIGQYCDLGFKFVHDRTNKKLLFTVYRPEENPNLKYSTLYGNMGDVNYTISEVNYKNVAVVAGSGEGDERITVLAGDTESEGSSRREMYVDARQVQPEEDESDDDYRARLVAYGEGKLVEAAKIENITFTINDGAALGDIVYVWIPEIAIKLKTRITGIITTSQNNGTTKEISIGTPIALRRL